MSKVDLTNDKILSDDMHKRVSEELKRIVAEKAVLSPEEETRWEEKLETECWRCGADVSAQNAFGFVSSLCARCDDLLDIRPYEHSGVLVKPPMICLNKHELDDLLIKGKVDNDLGDWFIRGMLT